MQIKDTGNYYSKFKTEFPAADDNINKFYRYLETVCFSMEDDIILKFNFEILGYNGKISYKSKIN